MPPRRLPAHEPAERTRPPDDKRAEPPPRRTVRDLARAPETDRAAAVGWLQAQAGNAAVGRLLARQPTNTPVQPALSFQDLWGRFIPQGEKGRRALLPDLVAALRDEDAVTHGPRLVEYLLDYGEQDLARDALEKVEGEYRMRQMRFHLHENKALEGGTARPDELPNRYNPVDSFLTRGRAAARSGDDALALELLTRAYLYLQMQLERAGPRGAAEPQAGASRVPRYLRLTSIYDQMRAILGLYPALERELAGAGNTVGATRARTAGARLRKTISDDFLLTGAEAMIADVSRVDTAQGPALRIHSAKGSRGDTDVTQLAGLPSPAEVGQNAYQAKPMEDVHAALEGQVDLLEDLLREPGVRKAFPRGDIDMSKVADRLKVWKAIYEARKGTGDGLRGLMSTIGRYLKAFTVHTEYNIRDFGATSYVQAEQAGEMATDLAGRAERDCGVYALTVASELQKTAKSQGLKLDFQLVTTLDHAMLVIREASGTFYIVSNDTVSAPLTGDVATELGKTAGAIRGRGVSVMPAMTFDLGASIGGAGRPEFSDAAAWMQYKQAQFGLGQPGQDKEPLYKQYYDDQAQIEKLTWYLEAELGARPPKGTNEATWLTMRADRLRPAYSRLAFLWQQWGTQHSWSAQSAQHGMTLGSGPLTLARIGKLILRRRSLRLQLDPLDDKVIAVCDALPPMRKELDAYRAAGAPADF
jgi:hypothetical protein